jgi:flagellar assembly protein FliH
MSNTSRVLKPEEMTAVAPLWWNGADASGNKGDPSSRDAVRMDAGLPPGSRERIEREAYERGFAEGQNMARAQAQAEAQPVIERMSRSLVEISSLRPRLRREAERDLVKLAIAIARRVLHRELTLDPSSLEGLIRVALEKLESRELCRVRVHPDQEEMLRSLLERFSNSHAVEVIPDKTLHAGDVLLETPHGTVDASVDAQLSEIERGFADRIQK